MIKYVVQITIDGKDIKYLRHDSFYGDSIDDAEAYETYKDACYAIADAGFGRGEDPYILKVSCPEKWYVAKIGEQYLNKDGSVVDDLAKADRYDDELEARLRMIAYTGGEGKVLEVEG